MLKTINKTTFVETALPTEATAETLIGNTPLLRLSQVTAGLPPSVQVLAKAEWYNPGGSIKDRAALNMIRAGEQNGQLTWDKIILDATSGNTGIGYAMIGAILGYRVQLVLPANSTPERRAILQAYGAELVLTDPQQGIDGAIRKVREMVALEPDRYFYADQYNNPANWEAHYHSTGPEIWQQTAGQITHFVAGLGTSGTMMGVGRFLRTIDPSVRLVSLQPEGPQHRIKGLKYMPESIVPAIYEPNLVDENRIIQTEDAYRMAQRLAREEGLFVGVSAAAAVVGAIRVARELDSGVVVTILPDAGYKYTSEQFWSN